MRLNMPDRLFLLTLLGLLTVQGGYSQSGQTVNIQLLGGRSQYGGRVEVQYNGRWWRVCSSSSYFRYQEATVVCRHLGYGTLGRLTSASGSSLASESRLQITCRGDESTLSRCSITPRQSCSPSNQQPVVECTNSNVDPYFLLTYGVPLASAIICLCAMCLPCCVACCLYAKKTGRSERHVSDHLTSTGIGERLVDQMQAQPSTPQEQSTINRSLPETPIEQIASNFNQQDYHTSQGLYEDIPETTVPLQLETNPSYNLANANKVEQHGHNKGDSEDYILMNTRSNNKLRTTRAPANAVIEMSSNPAYGTASTNTRGECDAGIQMSSKPTCEMTKFNSETGQQDVGIQMSSNPAYGTITTETGPNVNSHSEIQKGCTEMADPLNESSMDSLENDEYM